MKQILLLLALTAAFGESAIAHHGYAGYDRCKSFTVAGAIERISWTNPHVVFTIKTDDAQSYLVQWANPRQLHKANVPENALVVGDRVVVTGSAHRDPETHIVSLVSAIRRPGDGWEWSAPTPPPESC